jgi:hypothetical protein
MSGIDRSEERINKTHEFFTPSELLIRINDWLDQFDNTIFSMEKTFIDHSCGDGQILSEVMIRKIKNLAKKQNSNEISIEDFQLILSSIYGVELMEDNVNLCRERLQCGQDLYHIVKRNIVCHNALTYDYSFNGTNLTNFEKHQQELGIELTSCLIKKKKVKKELFKPNLSLFE